jgi:hypothetical protein
VPDDVLPDVVAQLRVDGADVLADVIEVALETEAAELGMDDADQPSLRQALESWAAAEESVPDWASDLLRRSS